MNNKIDAMHERFGQPRLMHGTGGLTMKLKNCPFCGGEAHINVFANGWYGYSVSCSNIFACGATQETFAREEEAIEAWNRRTK